jgi:hypothetical protein
MIWLLQNNSSYPFPINVATTHMEVSGQLHAQAALQPGKEIPDVGVATGYQAVRVTSFHFTISSGCRLEWNHSRMYY